MTSRRGQARAERVELIMEALLEHPTRVYELAAMADRAKHRLNRRKVSSATPRALANQPHQRSTVAIVGLKPPRPKLRPRCRGLRRSEQTQRPRPPPLDLRSPRTMQPARRLQTDHRIARHTAPNDQPLQRINPITQHRQRHRLADQPTITSRQPHPIKRLARINRNHKTRRRHLSEQQTHKNTPHPERTRRKTLPQQPKKDPKNELLLLSYQLETFKGPANRGAPLVLLLAAAKCRQRCLIAS
jgi:hypothetical protein